MRAKANKKFAENFKTIREKLFLSCPEMGVFLNVTTQQIYKYESGETRISMNHIHKICQEFGLTYDVFFDSPQLVPTEADLCAKILSLSDYVHRKRILKSIHALVE